MNHICLCCRDSVCGQDSGAGFQDCTGHSEFRCQGAWARPSTHDPRPSAQEHVTVGGSLHGRHPPDSDVSWQRTPAGDYPETFLSLLIWNRFPLWYLLWNIETSLWPSLWLLQWKKSFFPWLWWGWQSGQVVSRFPLQLALLWRQTAQNHKLIQRLSKTG